MQRLEDYAVGFTFAMIRTLEEPPKTAQLRRLCTPIKTKAWEIMSKDLSKGCSLEADYNSRKY